MAKKDKKGKKDKPQSDGSDVVERVRGAVERTFQATSGGAGPARDVGRSLLDEVASAAQRIRESFDDLRGLEDGRSLRAGVAGGARGTRGSFDDLRGGGEGRSLRGEIRALSRGVGARERQQPGGAAKPAAPTAKPAAARKPRASASKPAATSRASS